MSDWPSCMQYNNIVWN